MREEEGVRDKAPGQNRNAGIESTCHYTMQGWKEGVRRCKGNHACSSVLWNWMRSWKRAEFQRQSSPPRVSSWTMRARTMSMMVFSICFAACFAEDQHQAVEGGVTIKSREDGADREERRGRHSDLRRVLHQEVHVRV